MKRVSKKGQPLPAEEIARLADNGQDVSVYFTNTGEMIQPVQSIGVELSGDTVQELNEAARKLKLSRQTLIKRFIQRGLDSLHT
jgi:hypothetical protein